MNLIFHDGKPGNPKSGDCYIDKDANKIMFYDPDTDSFETMDNTCFWDPKTITTITPLQEAQKKNELATAEYLKSLTDAALDYVGSMWNNPRKVNANGVPEPDPLYRQRLLKGDFGSHTINKVTEEELDEIAMGMFTNGTEQVQAIPRPCECGIEKIGGGLHSDWCPKYKELKC